MNSSSVTSTPLTPTTASRTLNACKECHTNAKRLAEWTVNNPWVDELSLSYPVPSLAMLKFNEKSKAALVKRLGASGWIADGNDAKKTVDGIDFVVARRITTYAGEISEAEMQEA